MARGNVTQAATTKAQGLVFAVPCERCGHSSKVQFLATASVGMVESEARVQVVEAMIDDILAAAKREAGS